MMQNTSLTDQLRDLIHQLNGELGLVRSNIYLIKETKQDLITTDRELADLLTEIELAAERSVLIAKQLGDLAQLQDAKGSGSID